jgi:hypothetical protein
MIPVSRADARADERPNAGQKTPFPGEPEVLMLVVPNIIRSILAIMTNLTNGQAQLCYCCSNLRSRPVNEISNPHASLRCIFVRNLF